jgi:hypothetical protein
MIEYLPSRADVKFASPAPAAAMPSTCGCSCTRSPPASGSPTSCSPATLSQVNYSSIRAGLIEFRRRMEALQWQLLVPGLCQPVWRRFVATARPSARCPRAPIDAEWTAPRFEAVDPLKDIQADILAVRAGLMTLKEAIARQGYDPAQVLAEIGHRHQRRARSPRHHPRHRSAEGDDRRRGAPARDYDEALNAHGAASCATCSASSSGRGSRIRAALSRAAPPSASPSARTSSRCGRTSAPGSSAASASATPSAPTR